jgi:hypothetical protein
MSRFAEPKLSWTYRTDAQAECKLKFVEVPDDYANPASDLHEPAFLYIFTEQMPTPLVWRYTSYENTVSVSVGPYAGDYYPAPFSHGKITRGVKLDEEKIELSSFDFSLTANPLRKILEFSLEGVLHLDVIELTDVTNPAALQYLRFSGDAAAPFSPKGKEWKATFRTFGQFFQHQFPRFYFQRICNVPVYSPKCGVLKANFLTATTLIAFDNASGTYIDASPNPTSKPAGYFNLGHFETGTGTDLESRTIKSTQVIGTNLRLFFSKPLRKAVLNQQVRMYPGCNGSSDMCLSRFNNLANFRGFPFIPDKNPSQNVADTNPGPGGKK